ncbi:MAG: hypothetical protein LBG80_19515 [Bacteroidales bacterium]|jgi:hypothetical protein|nr:hypothetical protein [Bacteroidales bacterium]
MFDKEYSFRGHHAIKVKEMVRQIGGHLPIFERNYDVYLISPLIGFLYNRQSDIDTITPGKTDIFPEILIRNARELKFNYQIIMLLDESYENDFNNRITKAFKNFNTDAAADDEKHYNKYVLGGVEVIYEKIIEKSINMEDCLDKYYAFMEDFDERFNGNIDPIEFEDLFKLDV